MFSLFSPFFINDKIGYPSPLSNERPDQFTLTFWLKEMLALIPTGKADADDYRAISKLYYNLGKFEEFHKFAQAGIERFQDWASIDDYYIARLTLHSDHEPGSAKLAMAVIKSWAAELRKLKKDSTTWSSTFMRVNNQAFGEITFKQEAEISITLTADEALIATWGPFVAAAGITEFEVFDANVPVLILMFSIHAAILQKRLSEEQKIFLAEYFKDADLEGLRATPSIFSTDANELREIRAENLEMFADLIEACMQA